MTSRNYYRFQRNNFEILTRFAASEEVRRNKKAKIKKLIPQVNNIEVKVTVECLQEWQLDEKLSSHH